MSTYPEPGKPPRLSRDELVTIITDFYTFLTRLHIPSSALKIPPPGGWPNITPEATKTWKTSPMVIDLMKHLPYIDADECDGLVSMIHERSDVMDYGKWRTEMFEGEDNDRLGMEFLNEGAERQAQAMKEKGERGEDDDKEQDDDDDEDDSYSELGHEEWWSRNLDDEGHVVLENMLTLALGHGSGGRTLVLDVYQGLVWEEMVRCTSFDGVGADCFFADLQDKYERLELVPIPSADHGEGIVLEDVGEIGDDEVLTDPVERRKELGHNEGDNYDKWFKKIYLDHGWPGEDFRKEEALAEVARQWKAYYSDEEPGSEAESEAESE